MPSDRASEELQIRRATNVDHAIKSKAFRQSHAAGEFKVMDLCNQITVASQNCT